MRNGPRQSRRNRLSVLSVLAWAIAVAILLTGPSGETFAQQASGQSDRSKVGAGERKSGEAARENRQGNGERRGGGQRGRGGPATVVLDAVIKGKAVETIQVYGRVIARQSSVVAARTRGAVGSIHAQVGDRVRKNDVLVSLVSDMLDAERALKQAELKQFTASIQTVGAQLALANQELERLEKLRKSAAFSVARYQDKLREVERFKSILSEARAKLDQAQAELRMADINLHNAEIRAPFDGVITQRHVEVGNFVNVGSNVITVLNDTSLEVEAEIPANRLGGLSPAVEIEVQPEFGLPFRATVRAIVPEENALARTRLVRFTPKLTENHKSVAANQSVIVHIPSGATKEAVTVHKDAITQRRGQKVVFVADAENKTVRMQTVDLGDAYGARFEVLGGLRPGDMVVVRGNERLRPNQEIRVQRAGGDTGERRRRGEGRGGDRKPRGDTANGERGGS